jgi:hypothetical protein
MCGDRHNSRGIRLEDRLDFGLIYEEDPDLSLQYDVETVKFIWSLVNAFTCLDAFDLEPSRHLEFILKWESLYLASKTQIAYKFKDLLLLRR